jgi:hypothetical protein
LVTALAWLLFAFFCRHEKNDFTLQFFPKRTTRLLSPLEPVGFGGVAKELGGRRAALGDEHVGAGVEVVERVNTGGARKVGAERMGTWRDLTERTTDAWSAAERLEWMILRTPRDAIAAAMAPSLTVSIGEERTGERRGTRRVRRMERETAS